MVLQAQALSHTIPINGTVMANETVDLRAEASGRVTGIFFREGAAVAQGQVLMKIDDTELVAQRRQTEVRLELAQTDVRRKQQLFQIQAVSQEDVDVALSTVASLEAEINLIKARIAHTQLVAPFSGIIGLRHISPGSYVSPASPVATLHALNPAKIEFRVPEQYAALARPGQSIEFQVEGDAQTFTGTVYATEPSLDPATRTLAARATVPNPTGTLRPGAFAKVRFRLSEVQQALLMPTEAVVPGTQGNTVYVIRGGVAHAQRVQVGIRTDEAVQITQGLNPGDTVVVAGVLALRDGRPVVAQLMPVGGGTSTAR